jgi:hypothetical protein
MKTDEIIKYLKKHEIEFDFEKTLKKERNKYIRNRCLKANPNTLYDGLVQDGYAFRVSTSRPGINTSDSISLRFYITEDLDDLIIEDLAYLLENYTLSFLNSLKTFLIAIIKDSYIAYPKLEG